MKTRSRNTPGQRHRGNSVTKYINKGSKRLVIVRLSNPKDKDYGEKGFVLGCTVTRTSLYVQLSHVYPSRMVTRAPKNVTILNKYGEDGEWHSDGEDNIHFRIEE